MTEDIGLQTLPGPGRLPPPHLPPVPQRADAPRATGSRRIAPMPETCGTVHERAGTVQALGRFSETETFGRIGGMSKLTGEDRKDIPEGKYALPEERKYPVEDKAHARNAKARAAQQEKAGNLSAADRKRVDAKADKVLGKR